MKTLRGTKDILPNEIQNWQKIYDIANKILNKNNYKEIRTPIIEHRKLFERSIGDFTDIVNKEMYTFLDQGNREITLRPEGTVSIARSVINSKIYINKSINRLWYLGPMFRYERPQQGRQRQFHQLGVECIGSSMPIADVEVINIANDILTNINKNEEYLLEINSIGNIQERQIYIQDLIDYLKKYEQDLDTDSRNRLYTNPLRILDSKNIKTQEILRTGPIIHKYLNKNSLEHFETICNHLTYLKIQYKINHYLVRGLDYYNCTAFEIKTQDNNNQQSTICGGGRYDNLFKQIGGPDIPAVGWAIGIERLIPLIDNKYKENTIIYMAVNQVYNHTALWDIINTLKEHEIPFELDLSGNTLKKQIKQANKLEIKICFILGENEIANKFITIKWLQTGMQQNIKFSEFRKYIKYLQNRLKY